MTALNDENAGVATVASFRSLLSALLDEASAVKQASTVEPALNKSDFEDLLGRVSLALSALGGSIADNAAFVDVVAKAEAAKAALDVAQSIESSADLAAAEAAKADADALKAEADVAKMRQFAVIETATRDIFGALIVRHGSTVLTTG